MGALNAGHWAHAAFAAMETIEKNKNAWLRRREAAPVGLIYYFFAVGDGL
jgi:hypothetical protein